MPTFNTFKQQCSTNSQALYGGPLHGVYDWSIKLFTCANVNAALAARGVGNEAMQMVLIGTYSANLTDVSCDFTNRFFPVGASGVLDDVFNQAYIIIPIIQLNAPLKDDVWLFGGDRNSFNIMGSTVGLTPTSYATLLSESAGQGWYNANSIMGSANDAQPFWAALFILKDGVWYLDSSNIIDLSIFPNRLHATESFETTWANNQISVMDIGEWDAYTTTPNALPWIDADDELCGREPSIMLQDANNPIVSHPAIGDGTELVDWKPYVKTDMLKAAGKTVVRGVKYRRLYYPTHNSDEYISENIEAWDYSVERQVTSDITIQDMREDATIFSTNGLVALRLPVPILEASSALSELVLDENEQFTSGELLAYHAAIDIIKVDKRTLAEQSVYSQYVNCPILKHIVDGTGFINDPAGPIMVTEVPASGSIDAGNYCYYFYSIVGFGGGETLTTYDIVDGGIMVGTDDSGVSITFPRHAGALGYNLYRYNCNWKPDPDDELFEKFTVSGQACSIMQPDSGDPILLDTGDLTGWINGSAIPTSNTTATAGTPTFYRVPVYSGSNVGAFIDDCSRVGIQGEFRNNTVYTSLSTRTDFGTVAGSWVDSDGDKHLTHNTQLNLGSRYAGDYKLRLRGKAKVIDASSMADFVPVVRSTVGVDAAHSLYRNLSRLITAVDTKLDNADDFANLGYGTENQPISALAGFIGLTYDGAYKGTTIETADIDTIAEYNFEVRPLSNYALSISVSHTVGPNPVISWHWADSTTAPDIAYFCITVKKNGLSIDINGLGDELYTREQSFILATGTTEAGYEVTITAVPVDVAIPVASDSVVFNHNPNVSLLAPLVITSATLTATRPLPTYKPIELKLYNSLADVSDKTWQDSPSYVAVDKTEWVTQAIPALDEFNGELQFYFNDGKLFCNTDIRALASYAKLSYYKLYDYVTVEVTLNEVDQVSPRLYAYHLACLPDSDSSAMISPEAVPAPHAPARAATVRPSRKSLMSVE